MRLGRDMGRRIAKWIVLALCVSPEVCLAAGEATRSAFLRGGDRNGDGEVVVACLGDSNTQSTWQESKPGGFPAEQGWCERVGSAIGPLGGRTINLAVGGATIGPNPLMHQVPDPLDFEGRLQFEDALARAPVDVVILAFGTNDLAWGAGGTPLSVLEAYMSLWRRGRARGLLPLVALTPPVHPMGEDRRRLSLHSMSGPAIERLNEYLGGAFPPRYLLDFSSGMQERLYLDPVHLNAAGQRLRASRAEAGLQALIEGTPQRSGVRELVWKEGAWTSPRSQPKAAVPGTPD